MQALSYDGEQTNNAPNQGVTMIMEETKQVEQDNSMAKNSAQTLKEGI